MPQKETIQSLLPKFGESFLEDHAGRVIGNPQIAIVELVANSWDAGARRVDITWPENDVGTFTILDDGMGMTRSQFEKIWPVLNYNRVTNQGSDVQFPIQNISISRTAYGRNGKGRHSMFCFADEYFVETWRDNESSIFNVRKTHGNLPFDISYVRTQQQDGQGTKIYCNLIRNHLPVDDVKFLLGSKFITDPDFNIYLNDHKINLFDLKDAVIEEFSVEGEDVPIKIIRIESERGRLSRHHGVAWWVNRRLVGEHSWKGFEGAYLDGRKSEAKRFTFIIEADIMTNEVLADWSGFKDTTRANTIQALVNEYVLKSIQELMQDARKATKKDIIQKHKESIIRLSPLSKFQMGQFIDNIQMRCPTMSPKDLENTVEILAKMEMNITGYDLLQQLAQLSPNDFDGLVRILDEWSISDAQIVLDELYKRLKIIEQMEKLVDDPNTDELHELQPLFEKGLWIFGPEYETKEYMANRSLAKVVRDMLGGGEIETPLKRPDFVVLDDSSIGLYACDSYDDSGEVNGLAKVLLIELKRGGSNITKKESRQVEDYALEIQKSGKVNDSTLIDCYVLGSTIDCDRRRVGNREQITIMPQTYSTILRRAHARTFNLMKKIKTAKGFDESTYIDSEIKFVLAQQNISQY